MIAEKDATWEVKITEHLIGLFKWDALTESYIGLQPSKRSNTFPSKKMAKEHWIKYAKLNGITKYKIVGEE